MNIANIIKKALVYIAIGLPLAAGAFALIYALAAYGPIWLLPGAIILAIAWMFGWVAADLANDYRTWRKKRRDYIAMTGEPPTLRVRARFPRLVARLEALKWRIAPYAPALLPLVAAAGLAALALLALRWGG